MRKWNLGANDPYSIILAADQRTSPVDYTNHQIWGINLNNSEPPSIQLSTTFGFRAQNMRIFPQFTEKHITKVNPADFVMPPQINFFAPNHVSLSFEPFLGISINMGINIPDSQTIAGLIKIMNTGGQNRNIVFDLVALLNSDQEGQTIQAIKKEISSVLSGKTGDLHPVLFMTGGAEGTVSPYPSLRHSLELKPGESREFSWAMASLPDQNLSFQHARKTTARNWVAETQKIKMLAGRSIEFITGDSDWDSCFAFCQNIAKSLFIPPSDHLPNQSFVQVLHPDFGYSSTQDGLDYGHLWNGQSNFDVWDLADILLPSEPEIIKDLLKNFISIQTDNGFIDGKPGPSGQSQNQLAAPLLAQIALRVFEYDQDQEFLDEIYDFLLAFYFSWFSSDIHSGDLNIPVWASTSQSNFEFNPTFSHWEVFGQGANLKFAVCPDLLSYLYLETKALQKIAGIIGKSTSNLDKYMQSLRNWLKAAWDQKTGKFQYLDIETLQTQPGRKIFSSKENGNHIINFSTDTPKRCMLQINSGGMSTTNIKLIIEGLGGFKQPISIEVNSRDFNWILNRGTYTFPNLLTEIKSIQVNGLPKKGRTIIKQVNLQSTDHNSIIPISTGILSNKDIETLIKKQLSNSTPFFKQNGIPALSNPLNSFDQNLKSVWLPQNHMIIKAIYDHGHHKKAAEIFTGLMGVISTNLKNDKSFHRFYHAEKSTSSGEPNIISGLPSTSLFIHLLGMQIFSPNKVGIHGFNPFPWPVEINYRGLKIMAMSDHLKIKFPNGKEKTILDPTPSIVETST